MQQQAPLVGQKTNNAANCNSTESFWALLHTESQDLQSKTQRKHLQLDCIYSNTSLTQSSASTVVQGQVKQSEQWHAYQKCIRYA